MDEAANNQIINEPVGESATADVATGPDASTSETPMAEVTAPVAQTTEGSAPAVAPAEPKKPQWFILYAKTGYENKVKTGIEQRIQQFNLQDRILQVLLPEEEVVELRHNKRIEKTKKMFPGYVFVEMILDDQVWYTLRQVPGVAKFIGAGDHPVPVSDKEIERVFRQIGLREKTALEIDLDVGEGIRIISGPFRGYVGTVESLQPEKNKLRVMISIFGRDTPVELDFNLVEKL